MLYSRNIPLGCFVLMFWILDFFWIPAFLHDLNRAGMLPDESGGSGVAQAALFYTFLSDLKGLNLGYHLFCRIPYHCFSSLQFLGRTYPHIGSLKRITTSFLGDITTPKLR